MAAPAEDARELHFNEEIQSGGAIPVMISEVLFLLEKRRNLEDGHEEDGEQSSMGTLFHKTLEYAQRFRTFKNELNTRQVRELLSNKNLHAFEQAQLGNLCPESVEQAKALIPSLTMEERDDLPRPNEEDLEDIVENLQSYRNFQA